MTDDERNEEGSEELVEDLEASAAAQADVAGGLNFGPCKPTNACAPVNTLVHCIAPTQLCSLPTCKTTVVHAQ